MALIICPECGMQISDKASVCIHCGYPIKAHVEETRNGLEATTDTIVHSFRKPIFKRWWVYTSIGIVLVLLLSLILLLTRETKPKFDEDGKPIFTELTNEVYSNAKDYLGYHVEIKGKVFQAISETSDLKKIQIWLDPETCEQNLMIYYSSDVEVKQGDYIRCTGYIDSVTEYKNIYDTKLYVPLVYSSDLKKSTYVDVMAPAVETISHESFKQEKMGYSVSIDKIEFSEKETRAYVTVLNSGKANLYLGDAVIVQDGQQYNSTFNYEADYDEIPYKIIKNASSSGIIVFPVMSTDDFELSFEAHSDDFDEKLEKFVFLITKNPESVEEAEKPDPPIEWADQPTFIGSMCSIPDVWEKDGMPKDNQSRFAYGETAWLAGKIIGITGENTISINWYLPDGSTSFGKRYYLTNGETFNRGQENCGIGFGRVVIILDSTGEVLADLPFEFY